MSEETLETPQPTEAPTTSTKGRSSSGRNWPKMILAAVLGLVLLAGSACAGYWYGVENAKVSTQNAKTTSSASGGSQPTPKPTPSVDPQEELYSGNYFSLTLPEEWEKDPNPPQSPTTSEDVRFTTSRPTDRTAGGDFTPGWASLSVYITVETVDEVLSSYVGQTTEKTTLGGQEAAKVSGYTGVAGSVYFVTVVSNYKGRTYVTTLSTQDEDLKPIFESEFNQILSTFKFL